MNSPAPIPRRLVYRALAAGLTHQARKQARLSAPGATDVRRDDAACGLAAKADSRRNSAHRLESVADDLSRRVADKRHYQGPAIDAAVFGYVVALSFSHTEALGELAAELAELGNPGLLDGLRADQLIEIVDRLMPVIP